ncbi:MAG: hypothetical protein US52_C0022G0007 [candidate division WS6 bacterium GW2011_GWA2_37_6]|uniref:Uncharacterized protein n=1 Tax=candidate division WS6 bacterium GW2011_GWA2_37_6 TaxID=1619087 RepID=A0A0G0GX18_9BACT|nr:MAG: hypothetical protein US52_C0022G0007 [candidate division WS6 bacterium GW2011_GWA2_37_6]
MTTFEPGDIIAASPKHGDKMPAQLYYVSRINPLHAHEPKVHEDCPVLDRAMNLGRRTSAILVNNVGVVMRDCPNCPLQGECPNYFLVQHDVSDIKSPGDFNAQFASLNP